MVKTKNDMILEVELLLNLIYEITSATIAPKPMEVAPDFNHNYQYFSNVKCLITTPVQSRVPYLQIHNNSQAPISLTLFLVNMSMKHRVLASSASQEKNYLKPQRRSAIDSKSSDNNSLSSCNRAFKH